MNKKLYKTIQVRLPTLKKLHVCTLQNLAMYRGSVSTLGDFSVCPEGSFLAPEIGILFGDAVRASLVAEHLNPSSSILRFGDAEGSRIPTHIRLDLLCNDRTLSKV